MALRVLKLTLTLIVAVLFGAAQGLSVPYPTHHAEHDEAVADKRAVPALIARDYMWGVRPAGFRKPRYTSMGLDFANHDQLKLTVHSAQTPSPHVPVRGRIYLTKAPMLARKPRIELTTWIREGISDDLAPSLVVDKGIDPQSIDLHFPDALSPDDVNVEVAILLPRIANKDIAKWDIRKVEIIAKHLVVSMDTRDVPIWDLRITSDNEIRGFAAVGVGGGSVTRLHTSEKLSESKGELGMINFTVYPFVDKARTSKGLGQLAASSGRGQMRVTMEAPVYSDNKWKQDREDSSKPFNYLETVVSGGAGQLKLNLQRCPWRGEIDTISEKWGGKPDHVFYGSRRESITSGWKMGNERDRGWSVIRLGGPGGASVYL